MDTIEQDFVTCRVCGIPFSPRKARQHTCSLECVYRDVLHHIGHKSHPARTKSHYRCKVVADG